MTEDHRNQEALDYANASERLEGIEPNPAMQPVILAALDGTITHDRFAQLVMANAETEADAARKKMSWGANELKGAKDDL